MVQLSFVEEIKDKATRLIPTAYMEIVEECTAPHLLIPTYEHVKFLCETVNKKPDAIVDVVRALRRRIADNDVAVKHLTVQLLESMIKNSSTSFHIEVASQKGLLRDLVNVACMQPTTGRAMQAKEAALLLTLNLSIWFRGHPAEECYILTTLADDVRNQLGPNCFEGIEPERNTRVKVQVNTPAAARSNPRADPRAAGARNAPSKSASSHRPVKRDIIDAIPIDLPTPERVSAMLDVCMTFSEYLNNAAADAQTPLMADEVVQSYLSQVKADHDYVTILLSSNLQIDRDMMRTVADSQSAVLAKVEKSAAQAAAVAKTQTAPVPMQQTPVRSAGDTEEQQPQQQQHTPRGAAIGTTPSRATPPRAEVAAGAGFAAAPAPMPPSSPPRNAAPSVDDLFGDAAAASVSSSNAVSAELSAAAPAVAAQETSAHSSVPAPPPSEVPSQSTSAAVAAAASVAETAPVAETAHVDPVVPAAAEEPETVEEEEPQEEAGEAVPPSRAREEVEADHHEEVAEEEEEEKHEEESAAAAAEPTPETAEVAAAPAVSAVPAAIPAAPAAAPAAVPAAAPTAAPPKDDDDFDAFLEGRMST